MNEPPCSRDDSSGEDYSVREDRAGEHSIHEQLDFPEWTVSKRCSVRKITYELVCNIKVLIANVSRRTQVASISDIGCSSNGLPLTPKFLVSVSRCEYFCVDFHSVIRKCYIGLRRKLLETLACKTP